MRAPIVIDELKMPRVIRDAGVDPTNRSRRPERPARVPILGLPLVLAILSVGTAGLHFAVIGEHLEEYVPFGLFFACVAWLEALWAIAVVTWLGRSILRAGLAGNVAIVALWAASRTWGLPIGPEPWTPEPATVTDIACTALEVMIAVGCAGALWGAWRRQVRGKLAAFSTAVALILTVTVSTAALAPSGSDGRHGHRSEAHERQAGHGRTGAAPSR